jgi:hypothetical protein
MSFPESASQANAESLASILRRYYHAPRIELEEIERTETVEREIVREETVVETETVDDGPHPAGYVIAVVCLAISSAILIGGSLYVGIILLLAGGTASGLVLYYWRKKTERELTTTKELPSIVEEEVVKTETVEREIFGNERVLSLRRGSLSFGVDQTPAGTLATGPEPLAKHRTLKFPTIEDPDSVYETSKRANEALASLPWVLDGKAALFAADQAQVDYGGAVPLRGEERALREYFEQVEELFLAETEESIEVEVVEGSVFRSLRPLMDRKENNPDVEDNPHSAELQEHLQGPGGTKLRSLARDWEKRWLGVTMALQEARHHSLFEHVGPDCYEIGTQLNYAAFNFYCPRCNADTQKELLERDYDIHDSADHQPIRYSENTQCQFLPDEEQWRCKTCEHKTEAPIPIHRMLDDVLFPTYDHLMQENKNERLRIHAKAREKERDLQEKAETEADQIRHRHLSRMFELSEEMERIQADIAGEREAIASMEDLLRDYKEAQTRAVRSIEQFTEKIHEETQKRTRRVLEGVDAVKEQEMQALGREMKELSKSQRIEDDRRDAIQRKIAQNTHEQVLEQRRTTEAVKENTEVTQEGFDRTVGAINENTQAMKAQTSRLGKKLDKQLAHDKAKAEKQGLSTNDYNAFLHPWRKIKDKTIELSGSATGKSSSEIAESKIASR